MNYKPARKIVKANVKLRTDHFTLKSTKVRDGKVMKPRWNWKQIQLLTKRQKTSY